MVDCCLCAVTNLRVSSIGALDHIGSIIKDRPRVGPTKSVAAKGASSALSTCGVGTVIPSAILGKCPLSLADMDLGLKCLAGVPPMASLAMVLIFVNSVLAFTAACIIASKVLR